jgi:transposase
METVKRVFTSQFKEECIKLVLEQNDSMVSTAKAMNVGFSSLQRWVKQYR